MTILEWQIVVPCYLVWFTGSCVVADKSSIWCYGGVRFSEEEQRRDSSRQLEKVEWSGETLVFFWLLFFFAELCVFSLSFFSFSLCAKGSFAATGGTASEKGEKAKGRNCCKQSKSCNQRKENKTDAKPNAANSTVCSRIWWEKEKLFSFCLFGFFFFFFWRSKLRKKEAVSGPLQEAAASGSDGVAKTEQTQTELLVPPPPPPPPPTPHKNVEQNAEESEPKQPPEVRVSFVCGKMETQWFGLCWQSLYTENAKSGAGKGKCW